MNVKLIFGIVGSEQGKQGGDYYKEKKVYGRVDCIFIAGDNWNGLCCFVCVGLSVAVFFLGEFKEVFVEEERRESLGLRRGEGGFKE